jgi:hypothetical protein
MSARVNIRHRGPVLLLIVVGAALAWFTAGNLAAWVRPVALVALAGGGALLATRGVLRQVVAVLVVLAGAGLLLSGAPVPIVGAVAVIAGGGFAAVFSRVWPSMGARYERTSVTAPTTTPSAAELSTRDVWEALDRGEDPTDR